MLLIYRQSTGFFSDYDIFELEMDEGIMVFVVVMIAASILAYVCLCTITAINKGTWLLGKSTWPGRRGKSGHFDEI